MSTSVSQWRQLIIVGDPRTGRSSLSWQVSHGVFLQHVREFPFSLGIALPNGDDIEFSILVIQTPRRIDRERYLYFGTHVILIVYAVDDLQTFQNAVHIWAPEIIEYHSAARSGVPIFLVANKIDTRRIGTDTVSTEQGEAAAKMIGAQYAETSAQTGEGVRALFALAAMQTIAIEPKSRRRRSRGGCIIT